MKSVGETRVMTWEKRTIGSFIFGEVQDQEGLLKKNSTVLSCGGIFIPRQKQEEQMALHHVLTTLSKKEPVKIVTGIRPRNFLHEVMIKESMN